MSSIIPTPGGIFPGGGGGDAAAANAAKVAAEGFRDEAQGFRNEAEGFKDEAEAARDASQGFRNEAEGFKNDAEAARDAAAISEAACASAAVVAGMPGGALTVFVDESQTAGITGYATPGTNSWMDGESVIVIIRDGSNTGPLRSPICSGSSWAILTAGSGNLNIWDQSVGIAYGGVAGQVPIGVPVVIGVRLVTTTKTLTLILNGTVVASVVLASGSPATDYRLLGSLGLGTFNDYGSFGGTIYRARSGNFTLTPAEALGASRGESTGRLAQRGGVSLTSGSLNIGHSYRITSVSGGASFTGVGAGANTVGVEFVATGASPTWGSGSLVTLGTLASYAPENCLRSAIWCDESENCYDLTPFGGVVALKPKPTHARRIAVTCSGSGAIGANASASVGTLTGVTAADTAALSAIKAGDSVTAQFGSSMPAHIVALIANAPSAGAPVVHAHADATGDTVASSTALTLIHTQS